MSPPPFSMKEIRMSAPRNDAMRRKIYDAAIALFRQKGFKGTKYSDIADASGVTKSKVQHYFPKKEMLAEQFIDEHMDELQKRAGYDVGNHPLETFCAMGLMHFDFMLHDEEMACFNQDVLASRDLTDVVIARERGWAMEHLGSDDNALLEDIITSSLGGAYELLFQCARSGRDLDARYVESIVFAPLARKFGKSQDEIDHMIESCGQKLLQTQ